MEYFDSSNSLNFFGGEGLFGGFSFTSEPHKDKRKSLQENSFLGICLYWKIFSLPPAFVIIPLSVILYISLSGPMATRTTSEC